MADFNLSLKDSKIEVIGTVQADNMRAAALTFFKCSVVRAFAEKNNITTDDLHAMPATNNPECGIEGAGWSLTATSLAIESTPNLESMFKAA